MFKRFCLFFLGVFLFAYSLHAQQNKPITNNQGLQQNFGQVMDQNGNPRNDVSIIGTAGALGFHLTNNGLSYQLFKREKSQTAFNKKEEIDSSSLSIYRIDMHWLNASGLQQFELLDELPGYSNYYHVARGKEPVLFVKDYQRLVAKDIWKGIDLHLKVENGQVESDWHLQKASGIGLIQLEIKGAELRVEEGSLIMKTPFGELKEGKLKVLQNGKELQANWILNGNRVGFQVSGADPNLPLIIDPPTRIWATYFGGSGDDKLYGSTIDKDGSLLVCGNVFSPNMATFGSHQNTFVGGTEIGLIGDGIISKFTSNGSRMWSTYYGGNKPDYVWNIACDSSNNIFAIGGTLSDTGIATSGSHQSTFGGGLAKLDGFLIKFNSNGVRDWGTYMGGSGPDQAYSLAIDNVQNIYVSGYAYSNTQIATPGSWQYDVSNLGSDAFLLKYRQDGVKLWGTYVGGTGMDRSFACVADDSGHLYLAGYAESSTLFGYNASHQTINAGGEDGFLSKFDSSGNMMWSTYLGGTADDQITSCLLDQDGNICVSGITSSTTGIATSGAFQSTHGGNEDLFLAKFNTSGLLIWSTYFGSINVEESDYGTLTLDRLGNIYIAGTTNSSNGLSTSNAFQTSSRGAVDGVLAKFTSTGTRVWSTYFGGANDDGIFSLTADADDNIYFTGYSSSPSGISTIGSFQRNISTGSDGVIAKFRVIESNAISGSQYVCAGTAAVDLFGPSYSSGGYSYKWLKSETDSLSGFQAAGGNDSAASYSPGFVTKNTWYKRVLSQFGVHDTSNSVFIQPAVNPQSAFVIAYDSLCLGDSLLLFNQSNVLGDSLLSLSWYRNDTLLGYGDTFSYFPLTSGLDSIQFIVKTQKGCLDTAWKSYEVFKIENRSVKEQVSGNLCPGDNRLLHAKMDAGMVFHWYFNGNSVKQGTDSFLTVNDSGKYWIQMTSIEGCVAFTDTLQIQLATLPDLVLFADEDSVCMETSIYITDTTANGTGYTRKWWRNGQLFDSTKSLSLTLSDSGIEWFVLHVLTADQCALSDSIAVFVKANPVITGLTGPVNNLRIDSAYSYTSQAQSGFNYQWTIEEGTLNSGQGSDQISITWNDTTNGVIRLQLMAQNGCTDSAEYPVSMDLAPVIYQFTPQNGKEGDTIAVEGVNFTRTTLVSVGGVIVQSYQVQDHRHLIAVLGTGDDGNVRVESPYGNAELGTFNFQGVAVRAIEKGKTKIYPNPVQNLLYIDWKGEGEVSFKLYSANGQLINTGSLNEETMILDMQQLPAGIYFLQIENERFVIQKY